MIPAQTIQRQALIANPRANNRKSAAFVNAEIAMKKP